MKKDNFAWKVALGMASGVAVCDVDGGKLMVALIWGPRHYYQITWNGREIGTSPSLREGMSLAEDTYNSVIKGETK